jgi:hypothetical protein
MKSSSKKVVEMYEQENNYLDNTPDFIHQQLCFLNHLENFHKIQAPITISRSMLLPFNYYDNHVDLNFCKEFFARDQCQQIQEFIVATDYYEAYDIRDLFQREQENHCEAEFIPK